jgi:hypothetical protein
MTSTPKGGEKQNPARRIFAQMLLNELRQARGL